MVQAAEGLDPVMSAGHLGHLERVGLAGWTTTAHRDVRLGVFVVLMSRHTGGVRPRVGGPGQSDGLRHRRGHFVVVDGLDAGQVDHRLQHHVGVAEPLLDLVDDDRSDVLDPDHTGSGVGVAGQDRVQGLLGQVEVQDRRAEHERPPPARTGRPGRRRRAASPRCRRPPRWSPARRAAAASDWVCRTCSARASRSRAACGSARIPTAVGATLLVGCRGRRGSAGLGRSAPMAR